MHLVRCNNICIVSLLCAVPLLRSALPSFAHLAVLLALVDGSGADPAILLEVAQVHPEHVAEAAELRPALVGAAESEGADGGAVVEPLELGVGPEDVEDGPVALPEELEPGQQEGGIALRLEGVGRHGREEEDVGPRGRAGGVEVVGVGHGRGVGGRPAGVGLGLGLAAVAVGGVEEVPYDDLEGAGGLGLAEVAVLVEAVLGLAGLVEVDAQVEVRDHDLLVGGRPRPVPPRGQHIVQQGEGGIRLADGNELVRPAEGDLRLIGVDVVLVAHFGGMNRPGGFLAT